MFEPTDWVSYGGARRWSIPLWWGAKIEALDSTIAALVLLTINDLLIGARRATRRLLVLLSLLYPFD
jgi:hypothetical protein